MFYRNSKTFQDKLLLYKKCIYKRFIFIFFRVSNMISQFTEGLNSCGNLWDLIKTNWIDFLPFFNKTSERISRSSFRALFKISWSPEGTKRREEEEETIYSWELVLKMIEGERHFLQISLMFFYGDLSSILVITVNQPQSFEGSQEII